MSLVDFLRQAALIAGQPDDDSVAQAAQLAGPQPQVNTTPLAPAPAAPSDQVAPGVVPQFQPAPDLPTHYSILQRIGQSIKGGVQKAGSGIAGIDPAVAQNLSPEQQAQARKAALFSLGTSMLSNTTDRAGYGTTALERIGAGLQAGRAAAQQTAGASLAANQYNTQTAQATQLRTTRQRIGDTILPAFASEPDKGKQINLLQQAAIASDSAGDKDGAKNYMDLAKAVHEGRVSAQQAFQYMQNGDGIFQIAKDTGDIKKIATNQSEIEHERARREALGYTNENVGLKGQSNFNKLADPFRKAQAAYDNYYAVEKQALAGNPAATKTLVTAFASAADPKVQQRLGTIQYLQNIDPGLVAQAQRWLQTSKTGSLPPTQIAAMSKVVREIESVSQERYKGLRAASIRQNARLETMSDTPEEMNSDPVEDGKSEPTIPLDKIFGKP